MLKFYFCKHYFSPLNTFKRKGKDSDPYLLTNRSGSRRPKNMRIMRILIPNTGSSPGSEFKKKHESGLNDSVPWQLPHLGTPSSVPGWKICCLRELRLQRCRHPVQYPSRKLPWASTILSSGTPELRCISVKIVPNSVLEIQNKSKQTMFRL